MRNCTYSTSYKYFKVHVVFSFKHILNFHMVCPKKKKKRGEELV